MQIKTRTRTLEIPEPTAAQLRRATGFPIHGGQVPCILAAVEYGARLAAEAMESSRARRREEELMREEL